MSAKEKIKKAWDRVSKDAEVLAGVIQVFTAITAVLLAAIGGEKAPRTEKE